MILPLLLLTLPAVLMSHEIKPQAEYRRFDESTPEHVKEFYRQNHSRQTLAFVLAKKAEYLPLRHSKMGIWEAMELLDKLVDESDPDISLPQSYHAYQTAEAIKADGQPRWFILAGFIHDLGKVLALYGEPQWAVVGDTHPVGCQFSDNIVFHEYFAANPDSHHPTYSTPYGIYAPHCGLDNVHLSWGHDEYLYHVVKNYLPEPALYVIRYHSFYPAHREGAYRYLMNEKDLEMLSWLEQFRNYDLYSKDNTPIDVEAIKPYYRELVAEFFPPELNW